MATDEDLRALIASSFPISAAGGTLAAASVQTAADGALDTRVSHVASDGGGWEQALHLDPRHTRDARALDEAPRSSTTRWRASSGR